MNKLIVILVLLLGGFFLFRSVIVPAVIKKGGNLIDFKSLTLPTSPNFYLICPDNYCPKADHQESPVYDASLSRLESLWTDVIKSQPKVQLLAQDNDTHQYVYVQCSEFWHFPDFINVQFLSLGNNRSTVAIYSHSRFGHSDFGVNHQRVESWLAQLGMML